MLRLRGGGGNQTEDNSEPIERTNMEIIEWIDTLTAEHINVRQWQKEASIFFGYEWNMKTFNTWKEKFLTKKKMKKMEVTCIIMEEMGGTKGKRYKDIPPKDFFPKETSLSRNEEDSSETCNECNLNFTAMEELKKHVKETHDEVLKKAFRKEAGKNVMLHNAYNAWLQEVTHIDMSKYKVSNPRMDRTLKENNILKETYKTFAKNQELLTKTIKENKESYHMVRERSSGPNIIETKRTVLTQNEDGSIKKSVVLEQMAKITKRENKKRKFDTLENEEPIHHSLTGEGERKQAQVIENVLHHLAGKDFETKCRLVAKLIDNEGPEFAATLTKHSKEIQQRLKFTPEQTAAMISGTRTGDNVWAKFRTASNKMLGFNTLASHNKVKHIRKQVLPISRDDWQASNHMLYKNKQGKNKRLQAETCVLKVDNLK